MLLKDFLVSQGMEKNLAELIPFLCEQAKISGTVISQWGNAQTVGLADHIFVSSGHFRQER